MISRLISYITIVLGLFCVILFFESIYTALTKREKRNWIGLGILTLLLAAIGVILENTGILSINIPCW